MIITFNKIYIGLIICLLLAEFKISNPLPTTTTTTTEPPESNIISFLNQPGAGNHHIKKADADDDDNSIKPLDDILGLNFDLFDSWAKNSQSPSSTTPSPSVKNNQNEKQDHQDTTTTPTNILTTSTTEHTNIIFPDNRPLQQFHNTFHQIFATIRNQITDAVEQRRSSRLIKNVVKNNKNSTTTTTAAPPTPTTPTPTTTTPNQTNKSEKLRIRYHHSHHDTENTTSHGNSSTILESGKNFTQNATSEPRSSRLIANSPLQPMQSNILTVDLPTNFDNQQIEDKIIMKLNDSQNEFNKNIVLSENVNDILLLKNNSNIDNTIYNITSGDDSLKNTTTTTNIITTTPFIDLLNESNENDDDMMMENNLFLYPSGGFRNKTKALLSFVFTPIVNLWSVAQRNLPWISTFNLNNNMNNNNMAEIILDDDSLSEFNPEEMGNNPTLLDVEVIDMKITDETPKNNNNNNNYLSNIRNFPQKIFTERIPSVLSRIRQSISLPFSLPLYENNGGPSINNVYRKLNERMPFRKEFRKYATSHIDDDYDDDDEKYTTKTSTTTTTQNPITATKVNLTTSNKTNLNNETEQLQQQQFKYKSQQQKLQQIIDQNSNNKTVKKMQERNGNNTKLNVNVDTVDDDDDDENLIILNSKEYNDPDDNINHQMKTAAPVSASPRMYTESFGIYVLELFGTIVGLTWGALSTIQNLFTKS